MKLLFVSPTGSFFSGAEVAIVNLMTYLSQVGHQVYNVIPDNETNTDQAYLDKMAEFGIKVYALPHMMWWWEESASINDEDKTANAAYQHQNIAEVRRLIKEEGIDLVLSNTINVFQGALAAACEEVPHYYIIHEFPHGEFGYYREKIALINHLSAKIFVVSGQLYEELKNYFPTDKLLPFVPYTHVVTRDLPEGQINRLVSVGGITERKNQLELIKSYHALQNDELELIFIGSWDEGYKAKCDAYIQEHGLTKVSFLGHQTNPWSLVKNRDVLVFTSKMEAFPLVYVEAVLAGVPVIISDNGGHLSVRQAFNIGTVYQLGHLEQLTSLLHAHLTDFSSYYQEAQEAKERVRESYTLEKKSQIFVDNLLSKQSSPGAEVFSQVQSFLGLELGLDQLEFLKLDRLTVFLANEQGHFSLANTQVRPLEDRATFDIHLINQPKLRIDLSEFPGAFADVTLVSKTYQTVLEPEVIGGIKQENDLLFIEHDPQLIYDTTHYANDTLTFSYRRLRLEDLTKRLTAIVDRQNQELIALRETEQDYLNLENEYQKMRADYHAVIGSRRWIIPTKLINLIKRKF